MGQRSVLDMFASITGTPRSLLEKSRVVDPDATVSGNSMSNAELLGESDAPPPPRRSSEPSGRYPQGDLNQVVAELRAEIQNEFRALRNEMKSRGMNAAYDYDQAEAPKSKKKQKDLGHRMPPRDGDQFGTAQATDPQTLANQAIPEARTSMKKEISDIIGDMDQFREFVGLPRRPQLDESVRIGHSGELPTGGVDKNNKGGTGLAGLEGETLQAVEPEEMDDDVGDNEYTTLDQDIAMLKKENIDTDALWSQFLESKNITVDLFDQLVAEAEQSDDQDEIDSILSVEGLFHDELPNLLPEGMMDMLRQKSKGKPKLMKLKLSIKKLVKKSPHMMAVECDHDHESGGPAMPWMMKKSKGKVSKLAKLAKKMKK